VGVASSAFKPAGERTLGDKTVLPKDAEPAGRIVLGEQLSSAAAVAAPRAVESAFIQLGKSYCYQCPIKHGPCSHGMLEDYQPWCMQHARSSSSSSSTSSHGCKGLGIFRIRGLLRSTSQAFWPMSVRYMGRPSKCLPCLPARLPACPPACLPASRTTCAQVCTGMLRR
jgi:hypothetical protein